MKYKAPIFVGISATSILMLGFNAFSNNNQEDMIKSAEKLEYCADNIGQLECHEVISNGVEPTSIIGVDNGYEYTYTMQDILDVANDKRKVVDSNRQEIAAIAGSIVIGFLLTTPVIASVYLDDREKQKNIKIQK